MSIMTTNTAAAAAAKAGEHCRRPDEHDAHLHAHHNHQQHYRQNERHATASGIGGRARPRRPVDLLAIGLFIVLIHQQLLMRGGCRAQLLADNSRSGIVGAYNARQSGPGALEIIRARGFIGEMFKVPTAPDNPPLTVYHVTNPLADPKTLYKFPVIINHGVVGDAGQMLAHCVYTKPRVPSIGQITYDAGDTCLSMMLANNNFDVYMIDARGTNMNNHKASQDYNPLLGQKFWNFTLDEQALIDVPSAIDFVLAQTHERKVHYIGFSESTLFMFALLSHAPHYADKLASFVALAPVAYVEHMTGTTLSLFAPMALIPDSFNADYIPQWFTDAIAAPLRQVCQTEVAARTFCIYITSSYSGIGPDALARGFFATSFKSVGIKSIKHFMQLYSQRRFGMYDHGPDGNRRLYGSLRPPNYDLSRVRLPYIVMFRGGNDLLSNVPDQRRLLDELGTKPYLDFWLPNYSHMDFIMAKDIIHELNLPAARAMLNLLHLQTANWGGPLRDPANLALPKVLEPVAISLPNGDRRVELKSNLASNLLDSMVESVQTVAGPVNGTAIVQQPLSMLRNLGDQIDGIGSQLSRVGDLIGIGSIVKQE